MTTPPAILTGQPVKQRAHINGIDSNLAKLGLLGSTSSLAFPLIVREQFGKEKGMEGRGKKKQFLICELRHM